MTRAYSGLARTLVNSLNTQESKNMKINGRVDRMMMWRVDRMMNRMNDNREVKATRDR